jgi:hypothetical protein
VHTEKVMNELPPTNIPLAAAEGVFTLLRMWWDHPVSGALSVSSTLLREQVTGPRTLDEANTWPGESYL